MKRITFNKIYWAGLSAVLCLFTSCSDDELVSKELKAYVSTGQANKLRVQIVHKANESTGKTTVKFPVRTTRELAADANLSFEVDNSLITAFNQANNLNFQAIPQGAYAFVTPSVTIHKGEMLSKDSVQLELKNLTELTDFNGYLLPIRLKGIDSKDKGLEASNNMGTVYLLVNLAFENIDDTATSIEGTLMDRSTWEASASSTYYSYVVNNMLDSNNDTSWFAYGTPYITVDMKENATLKGFRFTPNYKVFSSSYNIGGVEVLISNNGTSWISMGRMAISAPSKESSVSNPDYKYVKFLKPVDTRYFRIQVTTAHGGYAALAELDAYK